MLLWVALVVARVVAESGSPAPALTDDAVLLIKRHDIRVGDGCGTVPEDAGVADCTTIPGDAVTLMIQPHFAELTTGARFAVLMVAPSGPIVETTSPYVFANLAVTTAPVIHRTEREYVDFSLAPVCATGGCGLEASEQGDEGCGVGGPAPFDPPGRGDAGIGGLDGGPRVDSVGPYEVLRAQPASRAELETWLTELGYLTLPEDLDAVTPYLERGFTVIAIRLAVTSENVAPRLTPLAITWAGSELRLPAFLGNQANAGPTTVYVAGDTRYDLDGAEVTFAYPTGTGETRFLTKNILAMGDLASPDDDPVAHAAPSETLYRETHEITVNVPVPPENYCGDDRDDVDGCGGCGDCSTQRRTRGDWLVLLGVVVFVVGRRRRR